MKEQTKKRIWIIIWLAFISLFVYGYFIKKKEKELLAKEGIQTIGIVFDKKFGSKSKNYVYLNIMLMVFNIKNMNNLVWKKTFLLMTRFLLFMLKVIPK
jgi:hypothetical protein